MSCWHAIKRRTQYKRSTPTRVHDTKTQLQSGQQNDQTRKKPNVHHHFLPRRRDFLKASTPRSEPASVWTTALSATDSTPNLRDRFIHVAPDGNFQKPNLEIQLLLAPLFPRVLRGENQETARPDRPTQDENYYNIVLR